MRESEKSSAFEIGYDFKPRNATEALLLQLRNFHMPWKADPKKDRKHQLQGSYWKPVMKIIGIVTLAAGVWRSADLFINMEMVRRMADRYVMVANRMYYDENNPKVAMEFLDKAIKLRDGCAEFRFLRAYIEGLDATSFLLNLDRPFTKPELDTVHKALAEAIFLENFEPSRPEAYLLEAQIYTGLKEYDRAEDALQRALAKRPENSYAHMRLGALRLQRGDAEGAATELEEALRLDPKSKWAWLWKGVLANDYKKIPEDARACYEMALTIDPKFDMAIYNLGWTWATGAAKDYNKARQYMLDVLKINPGYKEAMYAIGMFYGYEDNYAVAKVWFDKAIAQDSKFLSAWKMRGVVKMEMADHAGAAADFGGAIQLDPMNADLFTRRSKASLAMNKIDDALRDLAFAKDLDPKAKRTWMYLGDVYLVKGDMKSALESYDAAIAIDANYADAYGRKAEVFVRQGKTSTAIDLLKKAESCAKYKPERFTNRIKELTK